MLQLKDKWQAIVDFCRKRTEIAKTNGIALTWLEPIKIDLSYRIVDELNQYLKITIEVADGSKYAYCLKNLGLKFILNLDLVNKLNKDAKIVLTGFSIDTMNKEGIALTIATYMVDIVHKLTVENIATYGQK